MSERVAGGIQSLDAALSLLKALAASRNAMTLTDLARAAEMPATKAHRYLASFAAAGFVEQRERSGRYDLGPASLALGLSAMNRNDGINRAADQMPRLVEETGLTALLSIWGDHGPTVVRWERAAAFFITSLGLGTTMPLLNSATGRVFLAYLPQSVLQDRLGREVALAKTRPDAFRDTKTDGAGLQDLVRRTRDDGYASVDGRFIPGLAAIAAPVLDWQGEAAFAVTLIGTDAAITIPDGQAVRALKSFCRSFSADPNSIT